MTTSGAVLGGAWQDRGILGAALAACLTLCLILMPQYAAAQPGDMPANADIIGLRGVSIPISTSAAADPWNVCEREAIRRELADGLPRAIVAAVVQKAPGGGQSLKKHDTHQPR